MIAYENDTRRSRACLLAQVLQCFPGWGVALVHIQDELPGGRNVKTAILPYQKGPAGVARYESLVEGSWVTCVMQDHDDLLIVGPAQPLPDVQKPEDGSDESPVYKSLDKVAGKVVNVLDKDAEHTLRPFGTGADKGMLAGDTDIVDKNTGVGLSLRRDFAGLVGDGLSSVEVCDAGATRLSGLSVSMDTPLNNVELGQDYAACGIAASLSEAVGLKKAPMRKQSLTEEEKNSGQYVGDDKLVAADETSIPLYRIQGAAGAAMGGAELTVVDFPEGERHDADHEPAVRARVRLSLNGSYSVASSGRISTVKSSRIQAVARLGYGGKSKLDSSGRFNDLQEPWEGKVPVQEFDEIPEEAALRDAPLYELADRLLADDYVDALAEKLQERGFSLYKVDDKKPKKPKIDPELAVITPEEAGETEDPVTGEKTKVYDTTSFITQEPDGSICICDGYGSEIRMSQGNIYISPALDLFLRPGRDISVMAGRHQSYNSQGSMTLNTSDAMFIRSEHRMAVCAGTAEAPDREGLVIETGNEKADIVVRSGGSLSLAGAKDVSLARAGRTAGKDPGAGTMSINAGASGALYVNGGGSLVAEGSMVDICAVSWAGSSGSGSALRMTPGNVDVLTSLVQMPAQLVMRAPGSAASIGLPHNGKTATVRLHTAAKDSESLVVGGQMLVNGQVKMHQQAIVCSAVIANGVWSTSEYCSELSAMARRQAFKKKELPKVTVASGTPAAAGGVAALGVAGGLLSPEYLKNTLFAFPDNYGVDQTTVVPGMVWQEDAVGDRWLEHPVKRDDGTVTMPYPGANIWKGCSISGLSGKKKLLDGYRTNAKNRKV